MRTKLVIAKINRDAANVHICGKIMEKHENEYKTIVSRNILIPPYSVKGALINVTINPTGKLTPNT